MFDVLREPSTQVEQTLDKILDTMFPKGELHPYKIKTGFEAHTSLSGPTETVKAIYDMLQAKFSEEGAPFGEEMPPGNKSPTKKMGFYLRGETPFGYLYKPGDSRLVIGYTKLTKADLQKFSDIYHHPEQYVSATPASTMRL